jgi:uncharacterized membrane protein
MEQNGAEAAPVKQEGNLLVRPSDRARWVAAAGYIGFVCFFSLWSARKDSFIRSHASQGVLLFVAECAGLLIGVILLATVGQIKIVGLVIVGFFELIAGLAALMLSLAGFVKALFGEDWRMPFLGEYRDRVPGLNWQEG